MRHRDQQLDTALLGLYAATIGRVIETEGKYVSIDHVTRILSRANTLEQALAETRAIAITPTNNGPLEESDNRPREPDNDHVARSDPTFLQNPIHWLRNFISRT
jgi:hypothetical protein